MTNDNAFAIIAPLVEQSADHMRVLTLIAEGRTQLAADLIAIRMEGAMTGYAEGDIIEDEGVLTACQAIDSLPGPLARRTIKSAALHYAETH